MSVLPTSGIVVSAAGVGLAQSSGAEKIRAQQAATAQQRQLESETRAEDTAGIAATDGEDQETNDRDADGRRPWQFHKPQAGEATDGETPTGDSAPDAQAAPHPRPAHHGESGNQLDLTG